MKQIFLIAILAIATPLSASANESASASATQSVLDLKLIYRLAERPIAVVVGDRCEIRGAVWGNGPRPGVKQALVNVITGETYRTKTGANGTYSLSIPYLGEPMLFQERIDEEVFVKQEYITHAQVVNGGLICDHNMTIAVPPSTSHKETK